MKAAPTFLLAFDPEKRRTSLSDGGRVSRHDPSWPITRSCLFGLFVMYFYPAAWSPKGYGSDLSLPLRADDLFLQVYPFPTPGLHLLAA